jgi:glycerol kinase
MFGQAATDEGDAKNTYGTGCFLLVNTGTTAVASERGLLTTVAYQAADDPARYALEGSVAIAGAGVQWLRDNLRLIDSASEVEELATSVTDNGGVYLVPAFSGLFAPHWRADARGVIVGLTQFAEAGHIARAMLEAVAFQARDVLDVMAQESGRAWSELRVDGGMVRNQTLMQFQADLLDIPVVVPEVIETTVLGAAYAAGIATGFWSGFGEVRANWREAHRFEPAMSEDRRADLVRGWEKALARSLDWAEA